MVSVSIIHPEHWTRHSNTRITLTRSVTVLVWIMHASLGITGSSMPAVPCVPIFSARSWWKTWNFRTNYCGNTAGIVTYVLLCCCWAFFPGMGFAVLRVSAVFKSWTFVRRFTRERWMYSRFVLHAFNGIKLFSWTMSVGWISKDCRVCICMCMCVYFGPRSHTHVSVDDYFRYHCREWKFGSVCNRWS